MTHLERYMLLERVAADAHDSGDTELADDVRHALDGLWDRLSGQDRSYLVGRGEIDSAAALDVVAMPPHISMTWTPGSKLLAACQLVYDYLGVQEAPEGLTVEDAMVLGTLAEAIGRATGRTTGQVIDDAVAPEDRLP